MAEILLGNIRGPKGEQGKAFEFSDFTADQLESLRGPKGDTGRSTKTVTVEFSTRPTYRDFGSDNGGMQVLGNVPAEYYGVLTAGDFVVIPMVHGEDGSDVIVVGEFVDYQYNSDGQGFGIIFKNLAAIKGSIGPSGKDGATFTPAVDSNGNLSWTNNGNLTNPASVNIKGPQGDVGPKGEAFEYNDFTQAQLDGLKGPQGLPGKDGSNGITFIPSVDSNGNLSWTNNGDLDNPPIVNIKGPKGDQGPAGEGGGSGDAIPRTGDRGVLAGFNTINSLVDPSEPVIINGLSNDDTIVTLMSGSADIRFEAGGSESWCKQVLVFNQGGTCSLSVPDSGMVLFDNMGMSYTPSMLDLFVYVWYGQIGIVYTKQLI